jgi:hypothetical protein
MVGGLLLGLIHCPSWLQLLRPLATPTTGPGAAPAAEAQRGRLLCLSGSFYFTFDIYHYTALWTMEPFGQASKFLSTLLGPLMDVPLSPCYSASLHQGMSMACLYTAGLHQVSLLLSLSFTIFTVVTVIIIVVIHPLFLQSSYFSLFMWLDFSMLEIIFPFSFSKCIVEVSDIYVFLTQFMLRITCPFLFLSMCLIYFCYSNYFPIPQGKMWLWYISSLWGGGEGGGAYWTLLKGQYHEILA